MPAAEGVTIRPQKRTKKRRPPPVTPTREPTVSHKIGTIFVTEQNTPPHIVASTPPRRPPPKRTKKFGDLPGVHYGANVKVPISKKNRPPSAYWGKTVGGYEISKDGSHVTVHVSPTPKDLLPVASSGIDERYKLAKRAQVPDAGGRAAQRKLAATMTPQRRAAYLAGLKPPPDLESRLGAIWSHEQQLGKPGALGRLIPEGHVADRTFGAQRGVHYGGAPEAPTGASLSRDHWARYEAAMASGVDPASRAYLAATMTPERRKQLMDSLKEPDLSHEDRDAILETLRGGLKDAKTALGFGNDQISEALFGLPGSDRRLDKMAGQALPSVSEKSAAKLGEGIVGLTGHVNLSPLGPLGTVGLAVGKGAVGTLRAAASVVPGLPEALGDLAGLLPQGTGDAAGAGETVLQGPNLGALLRGDNAFARDTRNMIASAPVGGALMYNALRQDLAEGTATHTAQFVKEQGVGFAQMTEEILPGIVASGKYSPLLDAVRSGDWETVDAIMSEDNSRAGQRWRENPVASGITLFALVNGAARGVGVVRLASKIRKANPEMSAAQVLYHATRESYNPGRAAGLDIGGGFTPRVWEIPALPGAARGLTIPARRQWFRSPAGRAVQKTVDRLQRTERGEVLWSQARRTAAEAGRQQVAQFERMRHGIHEELRNIEEFTKPENAPGVIGKLMHQRARDVREAVLWVAAHGAPGEELATIRAAITELEDIRDTGARDIPGLDTDAIDKSIFALTKTMERQGLWPDMNGNAGGQVPDSLRRMREEQAKAVADLEFVVFDNKVNPGGVSKFRAEEDARIQRELESARRILQATDDQIAGLGAGAGEPNLWAKLRNRWVEIGRDEREIEDVLQTMAVSAANWGKLTGNDPTNFIRDALGVDDIVGDLPDEFDRILFQDAGYNPLMGGRFTGEVRPGDHVEADGMRGAVTEAPDENGDFTFLATQPIDPELVAMSDSLGIGPAGFAGEVRANVNDKGLRHLSLQPGEKVLTRGGASLTVEGGEANPGMVNVVTGDGHRLSVRAQDLVWSGERPVFHSALYRRLDEELPDSPTFEDVKRVVKGVSPEEMETTNLSDWMLAKGLEVEEAVAEATSKGEAKLARRVDRDEVLDVVRNGFSLHEVLLHPNEMGDLSRATRFGGHSNAATERIDAYRDRIQGLHTRPDDDGYRELVIAVGGPRQKWVNVLDHWEGVQNPLMHIRFIDTGKGTHLIEAQSDAVNRYNAWAVDAERLLKALDVYDPKKTLIEQAEDFFGARKEEAAALMEDAAYEALRILNIDPEGVFGQELLRRSQAKTESYDGVSGGSRGVTGEYKLTMMSKFRDRLHFDEGMDTTSREFRDRVSDEDVRLTDEIDQARQIESRAFRKKTRLLSEAEDADGLDHDLRPFSKPVPPPPFVGQQRYITLALRRLAAYSARHGYKQITWDSGLTHAIRYNRGVQDLLRREYGEGRLGRRQPPEIEEEPDGLDYAPEEEPDYPELDTDSDFYDPSLEIEERDYDPHSEFPDFLSVTPEEITRRATDPNDPLYKLLPQGSMHYRIYDDTVRRLAKKEFGVDADEVVTPGFYTSEHYPDRASPDDNTDEFGNNRARGIRSEHGETKSWRIVIPDEKLKELETGTQRLWQRGLGEGESPRGASIWLTSESGRRVVYLAKSGDASTALHELVGHATTHMRSQYPELWGGVEAAMGRKFNGPKADPLPYHQWRGPQHETYATWVERYHMEGKRDKGGRTFPDELRPFFKRLSEWMRNVYGAIKELGGTPVPAAVREQLDAFYGIRQKPLSHSQQKLVRQAEAEVKRFRDDARNGGVSEEADLQEALARREELLNQIAKENSVSIFSAKERRQLEDLGYLLDQRYQKVLRDGGRDMNLSHEQLTMNMDGSREAIDAALGDEDADNATYIEAMERKYNGQVGEAKRRRHGAKAEGEASETDKQIDALIGKLKEGLKYAEDPESGLVEALSAMQTLSVIARDMHREVLQEGLTPQEARWVEDMFDRRENLLRTRWQDMGLLPYGAGESWAYIPHFSLSANIAVKGGGVRLPIGTKTPPQLSLDVRKDRIATRAGPNRAILWQSGDVNMNPKVLAAVVLARIRIAETIQKRGLLWELGVPITKANPRPPKGWWVIREQGSTIPERLEKQMSMSAEEWDELLASGEDYEGSLEYAEGLDRAIVEAFEMYAKEQDKIPPDWKQAMEAEDEPPFRAVPPWLVAKIIPEVHYSSPQGRSGALFGIANLMARFNLIYQYPLGYIGGNVVNNAAMLAMTHPGSAARSLTRQVLGKTPADVRRGINLEMGHPQATAGFAEFYARPKNRFQGAERKLQTGMQYYAGALAKVADDPFRRAAWEGYAARAGFRSADDQRWLLGLKVNGKPVPRPAKFEHMTEEQRVALLNEIRQSAREDMIDFDTLSPREKAWASRWMFLWPLTKGMVKWPVTFVNNHPMMAAVMAGFADEESQQQVQGDLPPIQERSVRDLSMVSTGKGRTIDFGSVNPLGGLGDVVEGVDALGDVLSGNFSKAGEWAVENAQPWLAPFFQDATGASALQRLGRSAIPSVGYVWPTGKKRYPDRGWGDYWWRRNVRFWPENTKVSHVEGAGSKEWSEITGVSESRAKEEKVFERTMKRWAKEDGAYAPAIDQISRDMDMYWEYRNADTSKDDMTVDEKIAFQKQLLTKYGHEPEDDYYFQGDKESYTAALADQIGEAHSEFTRAAKDFGYLPDDRR